MFKQLGQLSLDPSEIGEGRVARLERFGSFCGLSILRGSGHASLEHLPTVGCLLSGLLERLPLSCIEESLFEVLVKAKGIIIRKFPCVKVAYLFNSKGRSKNLLLYLASLHPKSLGRVDKQHHESNESGSNLT
ncbi:hypothetical protein ACSQ67_023606 [Phaseolus vulgaris]